jgi:hypothetical protein
MYANGMAFFLGCGEKECDTGTVVTIGAEIASLSERNERDEWGDWERELIQILREVEKGSKRYVQLPNKWYVHK